MLLNNMPNDTQGKPNFEHPQSQSTQPEPGQVFSFKQQAGSNEDLRGYIDEKISTHIHNGSEAVRINANTDVIGLTGYVVYAGIVTIGGTGNTLPSGWTASKTSTGNYDVVHNLNIFPNFIVITPIINATFATIPGQGLTDFTVRGWDTSGAATNIGFNFVLVVFVNS